ncbi:MAG: hypothetical protein H5U19_01175 [Rhodobacteraceae bacterium]|jgi:hypothetical protein|nr:hypothetical protein [Paracoccaceae bacterium]
MTRHVADTDHTTPGSARLRQYVAIERQSAPAHPASKMLWRRPVTRPVAGRRMQEFLRIARGWTA